MRKAVIKNGIVENVIIAADDFAPPDGCVLVESNEAGPGWTYSDGKFTEPEREEPPAPPPSDIEIRLAALESKAGITDADVEAAKIALTNGSKI